MATFYQSDGYLCGTGNIRFRIGLYVRSANLCTALSIGVMINGMDANPIAWGAWEGMWFQSQVRFLQQKVVIAQAGRSLPWAQLSLFFPSSAALTLPTLCG